MVISEIVVNACHMGTTYLYLGDPPQFFYRGQK